MVREQLPRLMKFQREFFAISVEENDIIDLEKSYWLLKNRSTSGKFDLQTFTSIISPPLPEALCKGKRFRNIAVCYTNIHY